MVNKRVSWSDYYLSQAILISQRSTCTRLMVGSVIVKDNRLISSGYNGSVKGDVHCCDEGCYTPDGNCVRTVHAEANAIIQCAKFGVSTDGAEIYVTHFPCLNCTKQIIQAGIKRINYLHDYNNSTYAEELLHNAGVEVTKLSLDDDFFSDLGKYITNPKFGT